MFLASPLSAQVMLPVEDLQKEGAVQALHQSLDSKFSVDGGTITGVVYFTSAVFINNGVITAAAASSTNISTRTISGNTTLATTDIYVGCNATSAAITVTLPTITGNTGVYYHIKKTDSSNNNCTITPNGAETIDGATTQQIGSQYTSISIVAGSDEWHIF